MIKKRITLFAGFLLALSFLSLQAGAGLNIKLRFYGGVRGIAVELPQFVTSSYLHPTVTANIRSEVELEQEKKQIQRIFNLLDVNLIIEADLLWSEGAGKISHVIRLDGKEYLILLTPLNRVKKNQFRIEVFEQNEEGKKSLLDTEFILPEGNVAVFGFEDLQSNPYFLSLRATGSTEVADIGTIGGVAGGKVKDAVKATGDIKPPRLIKEVKPIYPEEARKAGIEGIVILSVTTDIYGKVRDVEILKRADPLLDQAAIDAVMQWIYEPMMIKGEPKGIIFTVTVRFSLK